MKLDAEKQQILIRLATAHTQLQHVDELSDLPEKAAVDELVAACGRLRDAKARAALDAEDNARRAERLREDHLRLKQRLSDDEARLSAVTDPVARRELHHDVEQTRRRVAEAKAALDAVEPDTVVADTADELAELTAQLDKARQDLADATSDLEETRAQHRQSIAEIAAQLPADVVEEFTNQQRLTGVGAVVLSSRTCHGCSMVLSPAELASIRAVPADEIARCPQCGTLLVRR